jgi:hypothetical protein
MNDTKTNEETAESLVCDIEETDDIERRERWNAMLAPYATMTKNQKRVLNACRNAWFLSGFYEARVRDMTMTVRCDSIRWLAREVQLWLDQLEESIEDELVYVRYLKAA